MARIKQQETFIASRQGVSWNGNEATINRTGNRRVCCRRVHLAALLLALAYLWLAGPVTVVQAESPRFDTFTTLPNSSGANAVVLGDFNGDGLLDVVIGAQQNHLYLNQGAGLFTEDIPLGEIGGAGALATGDFNNDGALDLVAATVGGNVIYLNQGDPNSTAGIFATAMPFGQPNAKIDDGLVGNVNIVVGDVNGDGALDVVSSGWNLPSRLYLNHNDGTGTFETGHPLDESLPVSGMAVGDLNGDGALDLVFGLFNGENRIYFNKNDRIGNFSPPFLFGGVNFTKGVALADLNGDEHLDLIVGNDGQSIIYYNNGSGLFTKESINCAAPPADISCFSELTAGAIMAGDVNGDGAPDLVVGDQPVGPQDASIQYYLNVNDGSGRVITDTVLTNSPFLSNPSCDLEKLRIVN